MNIVFLANRFPYPPYRGDKLKIYNLAKRLSKDHNLYLVTFYEKRNELEYYEDIRPLFKDIEVVYQSVWRSYFNSFLALFTSKPLQLAYFKNKNMHRKLNIMLSRYNIDVIHTQHLRMSQYSKDLKLPKILDLPDAFSLYFERRKSVDRPLFKRLIDGTEAKRLVKAEGVIKKYNRTLVCSKEDQAYLSKLHETNNVDILLNGVDLDTFNVGNGHDYGINDVLLFTGNMDYAPNVDAVVHFTSSMWPDLKQKFPNLKFIIAGQRPVESVKKLHGNGIEVTGFIEEISSVYKNASVVIAPLRFGAGTQNKVLEAMAMGVPTVCTHIGFEGLQIESGEGVILAREDQQFISSIEQLLNDQSNRKEIGEKGLAIARSRFSWDSIANQLESHLIAVRSPNQT